MSKIPLLLAFALIAPHDASAQATSAYLGMKDGAPRYAVPAGARGEAAASGLFPVDLNNLVPAQSANLSPRLEGSDSQFTPHYVIDFWRRYPSALNPSGEPSDRAPGASGHAKILLTGDPTVRSAIPAAAKAKLETQIARAVDLLRTNPWLAEPHGMELRFTKSYTLNRDQAGHQAYGFRLDVYGWELAPGRGDFERNGRWHAGPARPRP